MTPLQTQTARTGPQAGGTPWALVKVPPFPEGGARLIHLLTRPTVTAKEVARFAAVEPVFTDHVLELANSPLLAPRRPVKNLPHAVIVFGLELAQGLAWTVALRDFLAPAMRGEALRHRWRGSLAGALIAEKLAPGCGMDPGVAFTNALLRDIGSLVLMAAHPGPYSNLPAVAEENGFDLGAAEREFFDISHAQAGAWWMEKLAFPAEWCSLVPRRPRKPFRLASLVRTAGLLAKALGFGAVPGSSARAFAPLLRGLPEPARALAVSLGDWKLEITSRIQPASLVRDNSSLRRPSSRSGQQRDLLALLTWKLEQRRKALAAAGGNSQVA